MIRSFFYSLRQALTQIARNKSMALTSLFTITAMLLILGLFFVLVVNVNLMSATARDQFDMVEVFLTDEMSEGDIQVFQEEIEDMKFVDSVVYVSKDEAMEELRQRWGDNAYLLDGLSRNPLPRSLRVTLSDLEKSQELIDAVRDTDGVEDIKFNQGEVDRILRITDTIQIGALVIILFLIIISIIVVSNTVKLTVLARGREISIMKYVGATNWFIRGPFLAEGIVIGIIAAVISAALMSGLYYAFTSRMSERILIIFSTGLFPAGMMAGNLIVIFLALGVSIGAMGSIISMRRFLDT